MVRQYYVPQITELSEQELQTVFKTVEPPACLLGGWAVHLHVNEGFQAEYGREYIGSRDIDLGVHVKPEWADEELQDTPVGKSLSRIEDLGYTRSRFGFVQNFHLETRDRITEEKAQQYGMHELFQVYIDVLPDTTELDDFEAVFGLRPPAEPLLEPVFEEGRGEPLADYVSWSVPDSIRIVDPGLLAAMKIRSLPDRDKGHKQVKDLADLHALLWHVKDLSELIHDVQTIVSEPDIQQLSNTVEASVFDEAAALLQIEPELMQDSINRLIHQQ